jgi:hypothetical protein
MRYTTAVPLPASSVRRYMTLKRAAKEARRLGDKDLLRSCIRQAEPEFPITASLWRRWLAKEEEKGNG